MAAMAPPRPAPRSRAGGCPGNPLTARRGGGGADFSAGNKQTGTPARFHVIAAGQPFSSPKTRRAKLELEVRNRRLVNQSFAPNKIRIVEQRIYNLGDISTLIIIIILIILIMIITIPHMNSYYLDMTATLQYRELGKQLQIKQQQQTTMMDKCS